MPLVTLPYPNMDFVPLDILTATELDQMVANIEAINSTTAVDTLKNKFVQSVSDSQTFDSSYLGSNVDASGTMNLTQSTDSSTFRVFGHIYVLRSQSSAGSFNLTQVAGSTGRYGIKTTLKLETPPTSVIEYAGSSIELRTNSNHTDVTGSWDASFAVGTDGYIYIAVGTSSTVSVPAQSFLRWIVSPVLYLNSNF